MRMPFGDIAEVKVEYCKNRLFSQTYGLDVFGDARTVDDMSTPSEG